MKVIQHTEFNLGNRELTCDEGQSGTSKATVDAGAPVLREILRVVKKSDFKRWPLADEKTQDDIEKILRAAEAPAVINFRKEAAQAEAQRAVRGIVGRLLTCVQRMPLPPVGKEITLDYNDLIHKTAELEAVLAPTLRHNDDLEKELELQTALLAKEDKELSLLQKNARDNERVRAEQLRVVCLVSGFALRLDEPDRSDMTHIAPPGSSRRARGTHIRRTRSHWLAYSC